MVTYLIYFVILQLNYNSRNSASLNAKAVSFFTRIDGSRVLPIEHIRSLLVKAAHQETV